MGLYQQRHCQFEPKGTEKVGQYKGKLSDFVDSTGPDKGATGLFLEEKEE